MSLITLNPGEQRQVTWAASQAHQPPVKNYLIANLDETGTIFIGPADASRQAPDLATDISRSQLVALQAVSVSASQDWWAYNPSGGLFSNVFSNRFTGAPITIDVLPDTQYWAPSPYQQALSLVDQGLMTEATGLTIGTNTSNTASHTGSALTAGVPPGVPNIQSVKSLFAGPGSTTLFTFPAAGRLWGASLSFTFTSNGSFTPGATNVYAQLVLGSGITLEIIELAVVNTNQIDSDHGDMPLNGLPVAQGDTIILDVNNGTAVSNTVQRASGFVLYSIP